MTETQAGVMEKIETVAKSRGESIDEFMASDFGTFWSDKFYDAQPDEPTQVEPTRKEAPGVETRGFTLLCEEAKRLLAKDSDLTEQQAITKACELHPNLVASHESEIRKAVSAGA